MIVKIRVEVLFQLLDAGDQTQFIHKNEFVRCFVDFDYRTCLKRGLYLSIDGNG